jgi:hypothetical protein
MFRAPFFFGRQIVEGWLRILLLIELSSNVLLLVTDRYACQLLLTHRPTKNALSRFHD